jgi:prophage regulatory protein
MGKRLLRLPAVRERTGKSTSDIYEGMSAGTFPKNVRIGERAVGWVEDEIDAFIDMKVAARDARLVEGQPISTKPADKGKAKSVRPKGVRRERGLRHGNR